MSPLVQRAGDAISMQHDVHYSVCKDDRKYKTKADRKMEKALDNVPYNERQWGHWLARNNQHKTETRSQCTKKRKKPSREEISWQQQLANELHKPIKRA